MEQKITIDKFNGLYVRGSNNTIPPDHFSVFDNFVFNRKQAKFRYGTSKTIDLPFNPTRVSIGKLSVPAEVYGGVAETFVTAVGISKITPGNPTILFPVSPITLSQPGTIVIAGCTGDYLVLNGTWTYVQNPDGTITIAVDTSTLTPATPGSVTGAVVINGWSSHVGAFEGGIDQSYAWQLGAANTYTLGVGGAVASVVYYHTHQYAGVIFGFTYSGGSTNDWNLVVESSVPLVIGGLRSAGLWYSVDNGTTWLQIYNTNDRSQQVDTIALPHSQNLNHVLLMAFADSHDNIEHFIYSVGLAEIVPGPSGLLGTIGLPTTITSPTQSTQAIENTFFLFLDDQQGFHIDSGPTILSSESTTDFSSLNLYGRLYIAPNASTYVNGQSLYVFNGLYSPRKAAGKAPATGVTCADGTASNDAVSAGDHKFAVSFVTDSGFITPPSQLTAYTAPGADSVVLTDIPTGPDGSGIVGRRILCTQSGETELFFIPETFDDTGASISNGAINDNTTTTVTLQFSDVDLIESADYLNDIYDEIPSGTQILFYAGRLIIVGANGGYVLVSNVDDPETFSKIDGFLAIPLEDYTNPPVAGLVLRDTLYISKFPGVWSTQDTGDPSPNNWPCQPVDNTVGFYPSGIVSYSAAYSARSAADAFIVLTSRGILQFDGVFLQKPISWKIEDMWDSVVYSNINNVLGVNFNFWRFSVAHDPINKVFYINCADATSGVWFILQGDYSEGLDPDNIKWSRWTFPYYCSIAVMALHPIDNRYTLRLASFNDTKLWSYDPTKSDDDGTKIAYQLTSALLEKESGMIHFWNAVNIRASSSGHVPLVLQLSGDAIAGNTTPPAYLVNADTDYYRLTNYQGLKAAITLIAGPSGPTGPYVPTGSTGANPQGYLGVTGGGSLGPTGPNMLTLNRIDVFTNPAWPQQPA